MSQVSIESNSLTTKGGTLSNSSSSRTVLNPSTSSTTLRDAINPESASSASANDFHTVTSPHSLAHSNSTQLISGTLLIQSSPAAVSDTSTPATTTTSGIPLTLSSRHEAYKGDPSSSYSPFDSQFPSHPNSSSSVRHRSAARRAAAKGQSREELRQAFSVFDTDGDGTITTAEFAVVFKMLGYSVSDTALNEMIAELDENGNISFDEFVNMMTRRAAVDLVDGTDPMDDALTIFDTNDTRITKMDVKELKHICQLLKENLTDDEMDCVLKELQPMMDGDGVINYAKLVQQMLPGNS